MVIFQAERHFLTVTSSTLALICSPRMQAEPRPSFEPAGAGALLVSTTALGIGIGALVGWAAGSVAYGAIAGAALGVPGGVFAVYRRYRGYFT